MTDHTKYSNVSLSHATYEVLKKLSKKLLPGNTPLSISKTVETLAMEKIQKIRENIFRQILFRRKKNIFFASRKRHKTVTPGSSLPSLIDSSVTRCVPCLGTETYSPG